MILINLCYILISVGVSKILTFYSFEFSMLTHLSQDAIYRGLMLGSWGGLLGKFICNYFINRFKYSNILFFSFIGVTLCFILEFMGIIKLNLPIFYTIRTLQGFIAGIIYSTILGNLGEFYKSEEYEKLLTILTGGLSLAGTIFVILYVFIPFNNIIHYMFYIPVIGTFASLFLVKNRINHSPQLETKSFIYYFNILKKKPSLIIFALSFSFSLVASLLILKYLSRLIIVKLNMDLSGKLIRFIGVLPIILSSGFYFIKKTRNNLLYVFFIFMTLGVVNFFIKNIFIYMIFFCLSYGLHLLLLPHSSGLILLHQKNNKEYISYIIHALRSLFYTILLETIFAKIYFSSLESFAIFSFGLHWISIIFYFIGNYLIELEN
jgi:hypothetical protein